jgi:hypothetical protein
MECCEIPKIPRRFSHFLYGVIQSGLTAGIATAIASINFHVTSAFFLHWILAWLMMLPIVIFAAPAIRKLTFVMTYDEPPATDLTDILDQRDRDYCIAVLRSRCSSVGADVCGAGGR